MIPGAQYSMEEKLKHFQAAQPQSKVELSLLMPQWRNHAVTKKLLTIIKAKLREKVTEIGNAALTPSKSAESIRLIAAEIQYINQTLNLLENDETLLNS